MYVHNEKGGNPTKPPIGETHRSSWVPGLLHLLSFLLNTSLSGKKLKFVATLMFTGLR